MAQPARPSDSSSTDKQLLDRTQSFLRTCYWDEGDLHPSDDDEMEAVENWAVHLLEKLEEDDEVETAREVWQNSPVVEEADVDLDAAWDNALTEHFGEVSTGEYMPQSVDTDIVRREFTYGTMVPQTGQNGQTTYEYRQITNFVVDVQAYMHDPDTDETKVEMLVVPNSPSEESYEVTVEPTVFNRIEKFRDEVAKGLTTTFSGSMDELNELRMVVMQQDAPHRVGTTTVGLHAGEMVTPDGVVDENWIVDDAEHRYVDDGQAIETKWDLDIEGSGEYDADEVADILQLLPQTRDTERFIPILGWWYATLFAPHIRDWEDELPSAAVFGGTGSGKTTTLATMYKMVGMTDNPYSAQASKFATLSALSSTNNIPIWFDEYKPSDMREYQLDFLQNFIRDATKGLDETRGNADQTVNTYTMEAPVLLSGEQQIQGAAEERRTIRTQFRQDTTQDPEKKEAFVKLTGGQVTKGGNVEYYAGKDLKDHAKAIWQWVPAQDADELHEEWKQQKKQVYNFLSEHNIEGVGDLEITALTMIKWGSIVYNKFGSRFGVGPLDEQDIEEAMVYVANKMGTENRESHVDEFMRVVKDAALAGYIHRDGKYSEKAGDYKIVKEGRDDEELRLKLSRVHAGVSKYVQEHSLNSVDLFNSANDYKKRMAELAEEQNSYVVDTSVPTQNLNRCVAIDTSVAQEEVDGFDRTFIEQFDADDE